MFRCLFGGPSEWSEWRTYYVDVIAPEIRNHESFISGLSCHVSQHVTRFDSILRVRFEILEFLLVVTKLTINLFYHTTSTARLYM